jgi:hypothetical protein
MATLRPKFSTPAALTITLANLASSTTFVGRQSTLVDNSANRYDLIHINGLITVGGSSTAGTTVFIYLIKGDGTIRTDNAGAADAAATRVTAQLLKTIPHAVTTETAYRFDCTIADPGLEWGVLVTHNTGVVLKNDAPSQAIRWTGQHMENVA